MLSHCTRFLALNFLLLTLSGCATYSASLQTVFADLKKGQYQASEDQLKQVLSPSGADRLLYYLELGVIRHLNADYAASNQAFEQAERISEQLETTSIMNQTLAMFSNARQADYAGMRHEKLLINYFKALNYLGVAEQATSRKSKLDALEGARVEARRMIIKLNDLNDQLGNYDERNQKSDSTYDKIINLLSTIEGDVLDEDKLIYRDDALAHYLSAVSFEMNGEYDNARISYQKAAESYEGGYAEQFRLGSDITSQAWLDVARMMKLTGGFGEQLASIRKDKLDAEQRLQLDSASQEDAQLLVVEHKGFAPPLHELNIQLWADPRTRSLKMQPLNGGYDALAWFYLLYADKGVFNVFTAYMDASKGRPVLTPFVKTIYLGPLWSALEDIGLDKAIGGFLRVTVPYYKPPAKLGRSELTLTSAQGSQRQLLEKAASPSLMAIQQKLLTSSAEIRQSLAGAAVKALSVNSLASSADSSGLLSLAGGLLTRLTEASETRSWQLLPADIRIRRLSLPAGEYQLALNSALETGVTENHQTSITLKPGEIRLWQVRSMGQTPSTDY